MSREYDDNFAGAQSTGDKAREEAGAKPINRGDRAPPSATWSNNHPAISGRGWSSVLSRGGALPLNGIVTRELTVTAAQYYKHHKDAAGRLSHKLREHGVRHAPLLKCADSLDRFQRGVKQLVQAGIGHIISGDAAGVLAIDGLLADVKKTADNSTLPIKQKIIIAGLANAIAAQVNETGLGIAGIHAREAAIENQASTDMGQYPDLTNGRQKSR